MKRWAVSMRKRVGHEGQVWTRIVDAHTREMASNTARANLRFELDMDVTDIVTLNVEEIKE